MKGNLIAAGWDEDVDRIQLNAPRHAVTNTVAARATSASRPLDVTAAGDAGPFPGTIWVADQRSTVRSSVLRAQRLRRRRTGVHRRARRRHRRGRRRIQQRGRDRQRHRPVLGGRHAARRRRGQRLERNDPDDDNDGRPDTSDPFAVDASNGTETASRSPTPGTTTRRTARRTAQPGLHRADVQRQRGLPDAVRPDEADGRRRRRRPDHRRGPEGDAPARQHPAYAFQFGIDVGATGAFAATRGPGALRRLTPRARSRWGSSSDGTQNDFAKIVVTATGLAVSRESAAPSRSARRRTSRFPAPSRSICS